MVLYEHSSSPTSPAQLFLILQGQSRCPLDRAAFPEPPAPPPGPGTRHSAALHTHPPPPGSVGAAGLALLAPSHPSLFRSVPCEAGFMDQISHSPCRLTFRLTSRWIRPEDRRMGGREGGRGAAEGGLPLTAPPALLQHSSVPPSFPRRPLLAPSGPSRSSAKLFLSLGW